MKKGRDLLKERFEVGDYPTGDDFADLIDSTPNLEDDGTNEDISHLKARSQVTFLHAQTPGTVPVLENAKAGDIVMQTSNNGKLELWVYVGGSFVLKQTFTKERIDKFQNISGNTLDWRYAGGRITANSDLTLHFGNLCVGTYVLVVTGDVSVTFPYKFKYVGGERCSWITYYQVICLDPEKGEGIYSIYKEEHL